MAIIRTTRFKADPARATEVVARRAELISAVRAAFPGLTEARLAQVDEGTWVDMWRWDSAESLATALAGAPALPAAAAAFSLVTDVTAENADLVDER
ncbi:MAG: antibiotic biosynthesis monooxygenase [Actinobacteria bacterium]|nr:antibiotic biosynthesis monooxygenase [Actinomycetota bacterium]MBO0788396.1 antibiotic biosynthesis monooxygenase [Actinomycetota bacterium]MBO0816427.1 antibiotic biosynthesis monooxygenase [Actinomycetota bacterium]